MLEIALKNWEELPVLLVLGFYFIFLERKRTILTDLHRLS